MELAPNPPFVLPEDLPDVALSIRQPWVKAIMDFEKDIENRDWSTKFRGTFCVHAAQKFDSIDIQSIREILRMDGRDPDSFPYPKSKDDDFFIRGAIVGVVDLVDVVTEHGSPWFFGDYGFVLQNPRKLAVPIPVKGKLSFFKWRDRMVA